MLRSRERWFYLLISPWLIGLVALQLIPLLARCAARVRRLGAAALGPLGRARELRRRSSPTRASRRPSATPSCTALATVVPGLVIGLGLALLLGGVRRGGTILRATVFMPVVVAGVATALMWGWVLNPRFGLIDGLLGAVGIQGPAWLRDPAWAMPAMVLIGLWSVGVNVVVYLAALGTVPRELGDAASLDGAGPVARFRYITWPALLPVTFYLAIVGLIGASQVFTPTYVLTRGGPDDATLTTALYTTRPRSRRAGSGTPRLRRWSSSSGSWSSRRSSSASPAGASRTSGRSREPARRPRPDRPGDRPGRSRSRSRSCG